MKAIAEIATQEIRLLARDGVALWAAALVFLLTISVCWLATERRARIADERANFGRIAEEHWQAQPDRHPHRVVHFGDFVFKPSGMLSDLDPGIEAFVGHALFLEGHRQNTANFSEAGQSGVLLRFGQPTPAFVLQVLVPLLLIFVGHAVVARERASGLLRQILSLGVSGRDLVLGKALALAALAGVLVLPVALALILASVREPGTADRALFLLLGLLVYLAIWVAGVVAISARASSARAALLVLLAAWILIVIALPRWIAYFAASVVAAPSRVEAEYRSESELSAVGDSHDPDDPYFSALRQRTLAEHGVERIEDLPFNYGGLVMIEGERLSSEIFDRQFEGSMALQERQNSLILAGGLLAPTLALRAFSQSLAGTDLRHHADFLRASEKRRYAMVQGLNELHRREIRFQDDRDQRLAADFWDRIPRFDYERPTLGLVGERVAQTGAALVLWLGLALFFLLRTGRRLEAGV